MKKTLKCVVASISALAAVTASTLSASAAGCYWIVGSPNNCNSNAANCGTNVYSFCPDYSDLFSFLRSLSSGNLFGDLNGCTNNKDNSCDTPDCTTPDCTTPDCTTPDCTTPDVSDNTPSKPAAPEQGNTASKPGTSTPADSVSAYEKKVVELVNTERAKYGLSALTLNTELSSIARAKSQDMSDKKYFSHTSPTYGSPFDMMKSFGIRYNTAGENIAYGYKTPEAVVNGWMNSAGHRANILNASYKEIGVGYVANGNYWTQMFIG